MKHTKLISTFAGVFLILTLATSAIAADSTDPAIEAEPVSRANFLYELYTLSGAEAESEAEIGGGRRNRRDGDPRRNGRGP